MELKSLSASSAKVYEACPARWEAEYGSRVPSMSGSAANLGTLCHSVLQVLVEGRFWEEPDVLAEAGRVYGLAFPASGVETSRYAEGLALCQAWALNNRPKFEEPGRTVLHCEEKKTIPIWAVDLDGNPVEVPVNYIMDRVDKLDRPDGYDIEVTDYKTTVRSVWPDELRQNIQARLYAWAAFHEHPEALYVWVTFAQLRHEPVSVRFQREDVRNVPVYLAELAARILADTEPEYRINDECRFCAIRNACPAVEKLIANAGSLAFDDYGELMKARYELSVVSKLIDERMSVMDGLIREELNREHATSLESEGFVATLSSSMRRSVDPGQLVQHVPVTWLAEKAKVSVKELEDLIAGETDDHKKIEMRKAFKTSSVTSLSIKPKK